MTRADAGGPQPGVNHDEQFWRDYLENPDSPQKAVRKIFARLPSDPRCQLCASPFSGLGGRLLRVVGQQQSTANPRMCNRCEKVLIKHHGGAEVEGTMLFADIRGSTSLGERMSPGEFRDAARPVLRGRHRGGLRERRRRRQVRRRRDGGRLPAR